MTVLDRLYEVISSRKGGDPKTSYSAELLAGGPERCAKKMAEEAVETALSAVKGDKAAVAQESADLLYHLLVLWVAVGLTPAEVYAVLSSREDRSGHAEKRARDKSR